MGPLTGGRQGRHLLIFDGSEVVLVRGALRDGLVTAGEHRERRGVRGLKGAIVVALRGQKVFLGKSLRGQRKKRTPNDLKIATLDDGDRNHCVCQGGKESRHFSK